MAYPAAAGHVTPTSYIPTLYATKLLVAFYAATVFAAIANTEYEGMIQKYGDKVNIRTLPEIVVNDYVKGQKLNYQQPEPGLVELLIDKGQYWAIAVNAVDQKQSDIDYIEKWAVHASETAKNRIDTAILADIYGDVHASNKGDAAGLKSGNINLGKATAALQVDKTNIMDVIVDCGTVLDEQDAPDSDRFLVLPAWACGLIKKSDLRDASFSGDTGNSTLRNGRIGMIDRFTIYSSNNLATGTDTLKVTNSVFGQKSALTFASQMTEREMLKNPDDFGDLLRALQVYGYKVVKPEALGHLYIAPKAAG